MSPPALLVLRCAVADAASAPVQTSEVRDALAALRRELPASSDVGPLDHFWSAAGEPQAPVRRTWIAAALVVVEALVDAAEPIAAE